MDELALALELGFSQAAPLAMEALAPNAQVRAMCAAMWPIFWRKPWAIIWALRFTAINKA